MNLTYKSPDLIACAQHFYRQRQWAIHKMEPSVTSNRKRACLESDADAFRGILSNIASRIHDVHEAVQLFSSSIHPNILLGGTENAWEHLQGCEENMYDEGAHARIQVFNTALMRASLHMFNLFEQGLDLRTVKLCCGNNNTCEDSDGLRASSKGGHQVPIVDIVASVRAECEIIFQSIDNMPVLVQGMSCLPFVKENVGRVHHVLQVVLEEIATLSAVDGGGVGLHAKHVRNV